MISIHVNRITNVHLIKDQFQCTIEQLIYIGFVALEQLISDYF